MRKIFATLVLFLLFTILNSSHAFAQSAPSCNESTLGRIGPAAGCTSDQICNRGGFGYNCVNVPFCTLAANVDENQVNFSVSSCGRNFSNIDIQYTIVIFANGGEALFNVDPEVGSHTIHNPGRYSARLRQIIRANGVITANRLGTAVSFQIGEEDDENETEPTPEPVANEIRLCRTDTGSNGVPTALGCLDFEDNNLRSAALLTFGFGIAGGASIIIMAIAAFKIMTSANNPRQLQSGNEQFLSALTGLGVIILSALILRFFGQQLLGLF